MAEYWPSSLFAFLRTETKSRSIKTQKENELAWSITDLLYGIQSTEKMIFVLVNFRALKRKPVICKSDNTFWFSCFLAGSIPTEKSQKIFLLSQQIFCEKKLSCTPIECMYQKQEHHQMLLHYQFQQESLLHHHCHHHFPTFITFIMIIIDNIHNYWAFTSKSYAVSIYPAVG